MATEIILPKFGFTHEESQIARWLKHEGDPVVKGEPIAEVTTDKINMEVEAPNSGILAGVRAKEGETLATTEVLAYVVQPGEMPPQAPAVAPSGPSRKTARALGAPGGNRDERATPVAAKLAQERGLDLSSLEGTGPGDRITRKDVEAALPVNPERVAATPAARRLAREQEVDIAGLQGSGPRGRIQAQDILDARPDSAVRPSPPGAGGIIPLQGMRAAIAERMAFSFQTAPHFTLQVDLDASRIEVLRTAHNQWSETHVSATAIVVKVCAWALNRHPQVNASLIENAIHLHPQIDVGVAVALHEGLIVPVVHAADQKGIRAIAEEIGHLTERARAGHLSQGELTGGTFTVSNLGMFGIDRFAAIINPPESAILAVGQISRRAVPAAKSGDALVVRPMMTLTLSVDHRVLDGATAARFLAELRQGLENPGWLLF